MPDMHHVAVFHDVLLAFQTQRPAVASFRFGAGVEQLVPVNGFGADEMMFQVSVNGAGSVALLSIRVPRSRPGIRPRRR